MSELPEGVRGRVLAVALVLISAVLVWAIVVMPVVGWYGDRADRLEQQSTLSRRMAQITADLPELRRRVASPVVSAPIGLLEGGSDAIAGAALQQRLQQIASAAGATVASTEVIPGEQVGGYRRIGVRLSFTASWPVVVQLIEAITRGSPQLLINDLQIQGSRGVASDAEPNLTTSLVVFGFRAGSAS